MIVLDELGQLKRQLDALTRVEPGVAVGVVTIAQAVVSDLLRATDTLRDILSGHLDMDTARMGALRAVDLEEASDLTQDGVEVPGFETTIRLDDIAVHRIA